MAKIALVIGLAVLGAVTGGLGDLAFLGGAFATGGFGAAAMGASLGASAGSILGSVIFPPSFKPAPPLNDLQVMSSAPGNPIPWGYGSYRIAGNVIWADQITETTSTYHPGKGGSSSTMYTYTVSAAISFGYGPGNITRIWADSKLIYDVTGKGPIAIDTGFQNHNGNQITTPFEPVIYRGSATQNADPTIQASEGVAITPGFRDQIYIVLNDFPLADYGNRVPSFRAEITQSLVLDYVTDWLPGNGIEGAGGDTQTWPTAFGLIDQQHRYAYFFNQTGTVVQKLDMSITQGTPADPWAPSTAYIVGNQVLDSNGNIQMATANFTSHTIGGEPAWQTGFDVATVHDQERWLCLGPGPNVIPIVNGVGTAMIAPSAYPGGHWWHMAADQQYAVDTAGFIWTSGQVQNGGSYLAGAFKFDPNTFSQVATLALPGSLEYFGAVTPCKSATSGKNYLYYLSTTPNFGVIDCDANTAPAYVKLPNTGVFYGPGGGGWFAPAVDPNTGVAYVANHNTASPYYSNILAIDPLSGTPTYTSVQVIYTPGSSEDYIASLLWDSTDSTLIAVMNSTGNVLKINPATGAVISQLTAAVDATSSYALLYGPGYGGIVPSTGFFFALKTTGGVPAIVKLDLHTLEQISSTPLSSWITAGFVAFSNFSYDVFSNSLLCCFDVSQGSLQGLMARLYMDRQLVAETPLPDVLADVWSKAGGDPTLLNTSLVSGSNVKGYAVTQTATGKGILVPLCAGYFFDLVESDNQLWAIPRGQSVQLVIPETDLGLLPDEFEVKPTIAQENDLPRIMTLIYNDPEQNYEQGKQQYQRNARVKKTKNESVVTLPLTFTADAAASVVYKMLTTAWAERNTWDFNLWRASYLTIDPADVIQFSYHGNSYQCRVLKHQVGANMVLAITAVSEDPAQYVSSNSGLTVIGFQTGAITSLPPTMTFLLDIPFIQDTDTELSGLVGFYLAMSAGTAASWPGAVLFQSVDNQNWNQIAVDLSGCVYGVVPVATPAPATLYTWDNGSTVQVYPVAGSLASTTLVNVLNGANWFCLGGEIMGFATATLNADGSYTLSNLLRGLRGTEGACSTHTTGETFVLLDSSTYQHLTQSTATISALQYMRGVTLGLPASSGSSQNFTSQGNDQKPYAPAQFTATIDGSSNINMTWTRRTRIGGAWLDSTGTVPVSEASELYTVVILKSGLPIRTVTGLTSPSYQYTAANQVTDFGSHQTQLAAIVYQVSAVVGDGFPCQNNALITTVVSGA